MENEFEYINIKDWERSTGIKLDKERCIEILQQIANYLKREQEIEAEERGY